MWFLYYSLQLRWTKNLLSFFRQSVFLIAASACDHNCNIQLNPCRVTDTCALAPIYTDSNTTHIYHGRDSKANLIIFRSCYKIDFIA